MFQYHKHELEKERFGARAPRAEAVDAKRLICSIEIAKEIFQFIKKA